MLLPISTKWNDEAAKAIISIDPSAASVLRTVRGFKLFGREAPIRAYLEDGSQWLIEDGKARKLTAEAITESFHNAESFS